MNFLIKVANQKSIITIAVLLAVGLLFSACDNRDNVYISEDRIAPPVPTGVTSITGDGVIWLEWNSIIGITDLDGFYIYRGTDGHVYDYLATVSGHVTSYEDDEVANGITYYYGVSSFDFDGNESEVSFEYEFIFDTPRPEGFDEVLFSFHENGYDTESAFDFSGELVLHYNDPRADIIFEYDDTPGITTYFIWQADNNVLIQDMGYTDSFDDISYAPAAGWSDLPYVEAIVGHTYVLKIDDTNYAKLRITDFGGFPARHMVFDWGYQIDDDNRELKITPHSSDLTEENSGS